MEQSPLGSTTSDPENINGNAQDRNAAQDEPADQRLVADRLLAALASGNLEHLAEAREEFLKSSSRPPKEAPHSRLSSEPSSPASQQPVNLAASIEHRTAPDSAEHSFVAVDQLRQEEEELRRVEADLERRRAEVAAAKK